MGKNQNYRQRIYLRELALVLMKTGILEKILTLMIFKYCLTLSLTKVFQEE